MNENTAFLLLLRRLLSTVLVAVLLLLGAYLGLVRHNRARSYQRGVIAIDEAREFWPVLLADMDTLRNTIAEEYSDDTTSGKRQSVNTHVMTIKERQRIVHAAGVKVPVYARIYLRKDNMNASLLPGTNLFNPDSSLLMQPTVEVIAAEYDMMLSDFIANGNRPSWALDPIERETRLNSIPRVISLVLIVNAPGGYERAIAWVYQFLLMLCSFLLLFVPAYVWHDARGRYRKALLWTVTAALTNVVGLLAYLLFGRVAAATCHECGQVVNESQKFCPYCRIHLKTECLNCGQALDRNWQYCSACGAKPKHEH
jgi:hypothetical protein